MPLLQCVGLFCGTIKCLSLCVGRRFDPEQVRDGRSDIDIINFLELLCLKIRSSGVKNRFHFRQRRVVAVLAEKGRGLEKVADDADPVPALKSKLYPGRATISTSPVSPPKT